jgi:ATP-dependent protease ClpP protease subunit
MFNVSEKQKDALYRRGHFLITEVTHEAIRLLMGWILQHRPEKKRFTLLINSSGGSPGAVLRFASFLGTLPDDVQIDGVTFDECGSAALALLQCCHERIAVRYSAFFIHHVHAGLNLRADQLTLRRIREEVLDLRSTEDALIQLQCARTGLSRQKWLKLADRGELVSPRPIHCREALRLGLIDRVVGRYPLF